MNAFDIYFANSFEIVDKIKSDKNFVFTVYDKNSKKLCILKNRNKNSADIYKILKNLNNPHIPEIFRIFQRDNNLFIVEQHIDGQTLDEILTYNIKNFDENLVENILLQICDCLKILHENNIIHRDLTLSNIMLTKNNFVMLIDFGIARIFDKNKIYDTEFLGTKGYAAPEQYGLFDLQQSDSRTDIFNLGIAMKKLLGENYHGYLEKILNRCTNLNPDARYQNISYLVTDIHRTKKIFYIKKFSKIFIGAIIIFFITQIDFEDKKISPPTAEKISEPVIEEKIIIEEKNIENYKFPEIKMPEMQEFEKIPMPEIKNNEPEKKYADKIKIFFYLNGVLTKNRSEHSTAGEIFIKNYQNWKILDNGKYHSDYYLFPENYTARIVIENFTAKDLITPRITVEIFEEKMIFDKPTIKAGEFAEIEISLANKPALEILGEDNIFGKITIKVESPNHENIFLIRDLEVN